jgi:hypothetical protein
VSWRSERDEVSQLQAKWERVGWRGKWGVMAEREAITKKIKSELTLSTGSGERTLGNA